MWGQEGGDNDSGSLKSRDHVLIHKLHTCDIQCNKSADMRMYKIPSDSLHLLPVLSLH